MIDEDHNVTTETNTGSSAFQQRLEEVSAKVEEVRAKLRKQAVSNSSTVTEAIAAEAEEGEDLVRQHGDMKLYMFYMKSFHTLAFCVWTTTSFIASFCELFPGMLRAPSLFMQTWLILQTRTCESGWTCIQGITFTTLAMLDFPVQPFSRQA